LLGFGGKSILESLGFGLHAAGNLAGFGGQSDSNWGSQVNIGQAVRVPKSDGKDNVGGNLDSGNDAGYNLGDA
jgi:hypothetical protein